MVRGSWPLFGEEKAGAGFLEGKPGPGRGWFFREGCYAARPM